MSSTWDSGHVSLPGAGSTGKALTQYIRCTLLGQKGVASKGGVEKGRDIEEMKVTRRDTVTQSCSEPLNDLP